jgi:tetratricopeptide (TPR) repeat protein
LPKIPEIKRQPVVRPNYIPPRKTPENVRSQVTQYPVRKPLIINQEEQFEIKERIKEQAKQNATVDIDPYASIPENRSVSNKSTAMESKISGISSSPAVKSLIVGARADIAIGRAQSAVSKLERGLRIESQNPQLWYLLAKAHYEQSDYQQTISMARKSIRYTGDDGLIAQNWALIKQAGERSGDATAIKDALDYSKANP